MSFKQLLVYEYVFSYYTSLFFINFTLSTPCLLRYTETAYTSKPSTLALKVHRILDGHIFSVIGCEMEIPLHEHER
jgi:hypothetical protein